jgi:hypothetical protein
MFGDIGVKHFLGITVEYVQNGIEARSGFVVLVPAVCQDGL